MRLALPGSIDQLWSSFDSKVRNQVRKGEKQECEVAWGGLELLTEFYNVFATNMRDLGTPVFGRKLFKSILLQFPNMAELCVVRFEGRPVAAVLTAVAGADAGCACAGRCSAGDRRLA